MKQIPLLQGRALLIELPEGTHHWRMDYYISNRLLYWPEGKGHADDSIAALLPPGNWRIIGMLSEVTEAEAALVVPIHRQSIIGDVYKNFTTDKWDAFDALESLDSAIVAGGYAFTNPIPKPDCGCLTEYDREGCDQECWKHNNAQSHVLCRERCLLLGREI